jgi:hypothetical protein
MKEVKPPAIVLRLGVGGLLIAIAWSPFQTLQGEVFFPLSVQRSMLRWPCC